MTANPASHPQVASAIELFSAWVEAQMAYRGQPGLSVGLVYDQELVWARGFGHADREAGVKAGPDTIYRIASITKLFTATAVMQLRDAGRLQLDDPITRHLPWFAIENRHPQAPPITIRHLLTHTSGLPREAAFPYWTESEFPTRGQIRESLPGQRTILPTETEWKYSNLALTLAGEVVAAASGEDYADYIESRILEPLGMRDTSVRPIDPDHPRLAAGYGRRLPQGTREPSPYTDCRGITPAANMAATVEDLARFAMLQFRDGPAGGAQILKGSTLREMQRVHWLEPDWQAGWGLGFRITRQNGKTYIGHGGAVPGYRTQVKLCPAERTAVIVLTNADDGEPVIYADRALARVAPALSKAARPETQAAPPDPAWRRYTGRYRNMWRDWQVLLLADGLVCLDPSLPDPAPCMGRLTPAGEHAFRLETADGFGQNGELVVFELDGEGAVRRVKVGENYAYPVESW